MTGVTEKHGAAPYNSDGSENRVYLRFREIESDTRLNEKQAYRNSSKVNKFRGKTHIKRPIKRLNAKCNHHCSFEIKMPKDIAPVQFPYDKCAYDISPKIKKSDKIQTKSNINNATHSVSKNKVISNYQRSSSHKKTTELTSIDKFTFALVGSIFGFIFLGALFSS